MAGETVGEHGGHNGYTENGIFRDDYENDQQRACSHEFTEWEGGHEVKDADNTMITIDIRHCTKCNVGERRASDPEIRKRFD